MAKCAKKRLLARSCSGLAGWLAGSARQFSQLSKPVVYGLPLFTLLCLPVSLFDVSIYVPPLFSVSFVRRN